MKSAVLIPNMAEFPAVSMKRYARELTDALRDLHNPEWRFDELECHEADWPKRLLPGRAGEHLASRLARFVTYPAKVRRASGDVYHVLDHSHANLAWASPAEKSVLTCHDIIPLLAAKGLIPIEVGRAVAYTFPQRLRAMRRCRYVISDSESTKRDLIEHGDIPAERIIVVYLGIDPIFAPAAPATDTSEARRVLLARYGIPADAVVMMHLGTSGRYKNTPAVLRVLKRLLEEPELRERLWLLRAGAPFHDDENALIESLGIRNRIVHTGRIETDAALAEHYRASDIFLSPSLWEGFGWTPLESMACGTPVVTSNVSSLPEVVGDGGLTAPPNDIEALADAVRRIVSDDVLRLDLSARCLRQAAKFTWGNCARQTLAVYEKVAANV